MEATVEAGAAQETPGAAQPEGQSPNGDQGQGQGGGLYDLSAYPEELRPYMEQELRKVDANVTRKFQEHAEERKRWEPLAQIDGLIDIPPEELSELAQFRQLAQDPEQFEQWWEQIGEQQGYFDSDDDEQGEDDDDDWDEDDEGTDPEVASLKEELEALKEQMTPLQQQQAQQAQEQRINEAKGRIQQELDQLPHGESDPEKVAQIEAAVIQLAHSYSGDEDSISRAFEDYQRITGAAQGELVDSKLSQPEPAVNGGSPDTAPEALKFGDPRLKAAARSRLMAGG